MAIFGVMVGIIAGIMGNARLKAIVGVDGSIGVGGVDGSIRRS